MKLIEKFPELMTSLKSESTIELINKMDVIDVDLTRSLQVLDEQNTLLIGKDIEPSQIFRLMCRTKARHFVQKNRPDALYEMLASALINADPVKFVMGDNPFLLYEFVKRAGDIQSIQSKSYNFRASREKESIMGRLMEFVRSDSLIQRFEEQISIISDELMMNALYNAPMNAKGLHFNEGLDRSVPVEYDKDKSPAKLFIYHDDKKLLLGCLDPYGSFNAPEVVLHLDQVFNLPGNPAPRLEGGGSGLGLKLVLDNSMGFYTIVKPGGFTMVCCSFDLVTKYKDFKSVKPHIHFNW